MKEGHKGTIKYRGILVDLDRFDRKTRQTENRGGVHTIVKIVQML